jgi:hypothetical protein
MHRVTKHSRSVTASGEQAGRWVRPPAGASCFGSLAFCGALQQLGSLGLIMHTHLGSSITGDLAEIHR